MSRLKLWGMLFTCSLVSMFSLLSTLPNRKGDEKWERYERWIMSVTCISICLSFIGGLVSCLPPQQSLKMENPIITLCLIFWSAGLPAIMDPDKSLAVTIGGGIANANLYFFSWGSLVCCILLAGAWAAQYNGDEASATATQWCCLAASSFILMGTSSSTYSDLNCRKAEDSTQVCNRNLFAIILGIVSGFIALIMLPMKNAPHVCQGFIGLLLLVSWACGVAYITFQNGPGTNLGNVYFSTWISLFICINITTTCINLLLSEYFGTDGNDGDQKDQQQQGEEGENDNNKEDLPEEEQPPEVDKESNEQDPGGAAAATDDNAPKASV